MNMARIVGFTDVIGKAQGYQPLYVRKTPVVDPTSKANTHLQETAWTPDPEELRRLNAGASVVVKVLSSGHPPMQVCVGDVPEFT